MVNFGDRGELKGTYLGAIPVGLSAAAARTASVYPLQKEKYFLPQTERSAPIGGAERAASAERVWKADRNKQQFPTLRFYLIEFSTGATEVPSRRRSSAAARDVGGIMLLSCWF